MENVIAAFDFDGTLTRKDTFWAFLRHTCHPLRIAWNLFLFLPTMCLYWVGGMDNGRAKQRLFARFYKKWTLEAFDGYCRSFSGVVDGLVRSDVYQKMKRHQAEGHQVIIVSASIENWILPWAEKEGVVAVLATRIESDSNGILTGRFASLNCYGREKVRRILDRFPERDSYTLVAYGDSKGDREMLEYAGVEGRLRLGYKNK